MLTLILGGARSGKSTHALSLAKGRVLFVATAEALDNEMEARIAAHKKERPAAWDTLEEPQAIARLIRPKAGDYDTIVIDCLTLWVSNLMAAGGTPAEWVAPLLATYQSGTADWVVISNEVGLGIVPDNPLARRYRDALGVVNRLVAESADRVVLLVAGIPVRIKGETGA
ncbi:MAG TPA: bifunctional adenosylcobinamide kinase/adenosylcobinamide-phosphate guanylyltransferase [Gemmatimonadaceae bacterium]|nr:bifunctional adenosylcobinamide kinase/adenosylcobinamide-phosphate guanylyltransferase [Gemmatimonadaceae bacterium]